MVLHNPGILSELRWVYPEANMKLTYCTMIHNIWVKWLPIVTSLIMWLILWNRWASVLFSSIEDYIMMMLKLHDLHLPTSELNILNDNDNIVNENRLYTITYFHISSNIPHILVHSLKILWFHLQKIAYVRHVFIWRHVPLSPNLSVEGFLISLGISDENKLFIQHNQSLLTLIDLFCEWQN